MSGNVSTAKIRMLENSLRCFGWGLLGLLPVIGVPFAVGALVLSGKARAGEKLFWNAGRPYRIWGVVCAVVGTIFWGSILTIIIYQAANPC
jgi:hypothetical protein